MTDGEKRAYQRGYQRGCRWPEHKPPEPPNDVVRELMQAMRTLRDAADSACATLSEDDPFVVAFGPGIDAVDTTMARVSKWLLESEG